MAASLQDLTHRVEKEIAAEYPDLVVEIREGAVRVVGLFWLLEGGQEVDRYEITVVLRSGYPRTIPDVYETAGRIPRDADHHMYADGRACLFAPGEQWRHWPQGSNLLDFLNGPVRSFFISQALYERTGEWEFGQRTHGAAGILEAYGELLGTRDALTIVRYLEALSRRKLRPRSPCPCGSGRAINSCHMRKLAELRGKIPYRDAQLALAIVHRALQDLRQAQNQ
jgi:hypothetical protein